MDKNDQLFAVLLAQFQQVCMIGLGKMTRPEGGTQVNLEEAAYAIDMLSMLKEKTTGNLSPELANALEQALRDLQLNYVEVRKQQDAAPADTAQGDTDKDE